MASTVPHAPRPDAPRAGRPIGPAAFALRFLLLFALLSGAWSACRGTVVEPLAVDAAFVAPAAALAAALAPHDGVAASGRAIASPQARLRVLPGCEGIETLLLIAAGVLAFPAGARRRAAGLVLGVALAWALSVARLVLLYLGLRYAPGAFEWTHGLIAPLAPVALLALYFLAWSGLALRAPAPRLRDP